MSTFSSPCIQHDTFEDLHESAEEGVIIWVFATKACVVKNSEEKRQTTRFTNRATMNM